MSLNIDKLENVNYKGLRISARCPACAEQGRDNKGDHLSIDEQGRFSCVIYPGETGTDHRKRIFVLVGINNGNGKLYSQPQNKMMKVKKIILNHGTVIKTNILGHLGRVNQTLKKQNENDIKERICNKDFEKGVPSVPTTETVSKACSVKTETKVPLTVVKMCECGCPATTYDFGEIENGKLDWKFYCNTCNSRPLPIRRHNAVNSDNYMCKRCGKPGQRYCYGESKSGKHVWGRFCLECYPHHF